MLEEVLSRHVLWYNDKGVYIGACLVSAHAEVMSERRALTRPIDPQAITPECKDFAAGFIHHELREVFGFTDMSDELHSDPLYKLERRFPALKISVKGSAIGFALRLAFALSPPSPQNCFGS